MTNFLLYKKYIYRVNSRARSREILAFFWSRSRIFETDARKISRFWALGRLFSFTTRAKQNCVATFVDQAEP